MIPDLNVPATPEHNRLIEKLERAAGQKLSKEEIFEQEVSFVYGNLPPTRTLTREQVRAHLLERRGEP